MCRVSYRADSSQHTTNQRASSDTLSNDDRATRVPGKSQKSPRASRIRTPVQKRSKATYEKILNVSTELIVEQGLEGFTTNAVAERAGINIATVYAYFPDKLAILAELVVRSEQSNTDWLSDHFGATNNDDWRTQLGQAVEALVESRLRNPAGKMLRSVAQATPELRHFYDAAIARNAEVLALAIQRWNPELGEQQALQVSEVMIRSAIGVIDAATAQGSRDHAQLHELMRLLDSYLSNYVDDTGTPA